MWLWKQEMVPVWYLRCAPWSCVVAADKRIPPMACACVVLDSWVSSSSTEHRITERRRLHANHVCWWETVAHCCASFYSTDWGNPNPVSRFAPRTLTLINLISFMCASCHVSAVCLCRQRRRQQHSSRYSAKGGGEREEPFFAQEKKVPTGRLRKPSRWYHQISVDGEKKEGWV